MLNDSWKFITKFLGHITNVKIETNIVCKATFQKQDIHNQIYKQRHVKHQYWIMNVKMIPKGGH
jgi:hypothetical protein